MGLRETDVRCLTRRSLVAAAVISATACTASSSENNSSVPGWISDFVRLFYVEKNVRAAFEAHVIEHYRQHSAGMTDGREAAIAILDPLFSRDEFSASPLRVIIDGNLALVLLNVSAGTSVRALVIDIYRIEAEKFVEHWDIKLELPVEIADEYLLGLAAG